MYLVPLPPYFMCIFWINNIVDARVYAQYFGYIYNFEKGEKNIYGVSLKMQCIFTKKMQSIVVVRSKVALTLTSKSKTFCTWLCTIIS